MERLLLDLSINVTSMFRDPSFYAAFRKQVAPLLRTYPFTRIWIWATGEEVYSLAIVLEEEGCSRARASMRRTSTRPCSPRPGSASFRSRRCRSTRRTTSRPAAQAFSEYYSRTTTARRSIRRLVEPRFAQHNLVSDRSFNEFHVIVCRNVMIYFDRSLQERVFQLFHESLARLGVLALGHKETIRLSSYADRYEPLDPVEKLWRKVA